MKQSTEQPIATVDKKNLFWLDGFLTDAQCAFVREELEFAFWHRSAVIKKVENNQIESFHSASRTSETAAQEWFSDELLAFMGELETRLESLLGTSRQRFEYWQATHYDLNGQFDYHHDAGYWEEDPAGERQHTILIYLDTPAAGGQTHFRAQNIRVQAIAGRLLIWNNLLPTGHCNYGMIHASMPVLAGHKTTLITWERLKPFRTGILNQLS
ncbi:2OG-Fe(II) oxygenase [Spirosoma spitsbergense]|jgi:predicted 2-oxoglutarate/Fe(II)-dependent dioxygenase YbiX|uniref:2OG-Fe(II) oxygenase n=1 Tax=Spirosoma spitsbergense TaxID=431554 RepID=UPI0003748EC3|nr:2OG-Fe(II) oxygenase [Spirosoma spitsbergense]